MGFHMANERQFPYSRPHASRNAVTIAFTYSTNSISIPSREFSRPVILRTEGGRRSAKSVWVMM